MRTLKLIIIAMGLAGCSSDKTPKNINAYKAEHLPYGLDLITLDSCEYWRSLSYMSYFTLTHKGNCSNPIHTH